jgi:cell division transport system ATP-binding protein
MSGSDGSRGVINLVDVCLENPRGGPPLVRDASLRVGSGEVVLVVGSAGAGTSRLVAAALGEVALSKGAIELLGHDVGKLRRASLRLMRRRIGIVPQDLCLLDDRSVQLNVVLPLEIDGVPRSASILQASRILAQLDLESEAALPIDCLGAAVRQRVALARALVREPDLILADHPTSHQDARGAELVCTALAIAAARGAGVIVFGRDPALLALAERHHWRRIDIVDGELKSLAVDPVVVETLSALDSTPTSVLPAPPPEQLENVVPFPVAAAAGGAA